MLIWLAHAFRTKLLCMSSYFRLKRRCSNFNIRNWFKLTFQEPILTSVGKTCTPSYFLLLLFKSTEFNPRNNVRLFLLLLYTHAKFILSNKTFMEVRGIPHISKATQERRAQLQCGRMQISGKRTWVGYHLKESTNSFKFKTHEWSIS